MKHRKEPRHKGKPQPKMKQTTLNTVIMAQAMELRDDITLVRMRFDQFLTLLGQREDE